MAKAASGYGLGLACFALVAASLAGATQFQVGGNSGWSVAGASAQSYNAWAMKNRFQIGDTLVFVYPKDKDSVLVVQPADYNACNTSSYDKKFTDGNTVFTLDRAGAFFFVSGVDANCRANEKLIVMVLSGRNGNDSGGSAPSPSSPAAPPPASPTPPPSASPAPSASSPPPATATPPAPAPRAASPTTSSPPPAPGSAPATPPSSAPPASSPPSAPPSSTPPSPTPSATAGAPPMPTPASAPGGADGGSTNSTGASPPAGPTDQSGAGFTVNDAAGLAGSAAACIVGYAMLAL